MKLAAVLVAAVAILSSCEGETSPSVPGGRDVTFDGPGGEIEASIYNASSGTSGIVFAHQNGLDRTSWSELAAELARKGYTGLTFDFNDVDLDGEVRAAVEYLRSQSVGKVFLIGASKGGAAVLAVAATDDDIEGVVSLSGVESFGDISLDEATVSQISAPLLFVVDPGDDAASDAGDFMAWATAPKTLETFENAGHGTEMLGSDSGDEIEDLILGFLKDGTKS